MCAWRQISSQVYRYLHAVYVCVKIGSRVYVIYETNSNAIRIYYAYIYIIFGAIYHVPSPRLSAAAITYKRFVLLDVGQQVSIDNIIIQTFQLLSEQYRC